MYIALVRHGIAERSAPGGTDEKRELTPDGRHRIKVEGKFLKHSAWRFHRVLSSPLVRARQTAEVLADALGMEVEVDRLLRPGMTAHDILEVASRYDVGDGIILVAHQPDLSIAARDLCGAELSFDEGAMALIRVKDPFRPDGRLEAFLRGEAMTKAGRS